MTAPPIRDTAGRPASELSGATATNSTPSGFTFWGYPSAAYLTDAAMVAAAATAQLGDFAYRYNATTGGVSIRVLRALPASAAGNWAYFTMEYADLSSVPHTLTAISPDVLADAVSRFAPLAATVQILPLAAAVSIGSAVQLAAGAFDGSGYSMPEKPIGYAVSNPGIVSVSATGRASVLAAGLSIITAFTENAAASMLLNATFGVAPSVWYARDSFLGAPNGTIISTWPDISGNARDQIQSYYAYKPGFQTQIGLNGSVGGPVDNFKLGVGFASPVYFFQAWTECATFNALNGLTGATLYCCFNSTTSTYSQCVFSTPDRLFELVLLGSPAGTYRLYMGATAYADFVLTVPSPYDDRWVLEIVWDGSGATNADRLKISVQGAAQTLTFTGTIPTSIGTPTLGLALGKSYVTAYNHNWCGYIAEFVLFPAALSSTDRTTVRTSLESKYQITGT